MKSYDNNIPIYLQIMEELKRDLAAGKLTPGEKLPSVRDLAQSFEVNPNTMQRALAELEREQLFYTERTSGRFVTTDEMVIMTLKNRLAEQELQKFMEYMQKIGYTKTEIIAKIQSWKQEEETL